MTELATWSWRARDRGGNLLSGALAAATAQEVAARLRSEGKVVLGVQRGTDTTQSSQRSDRPNGRRVPRTEVLEFSRQLSVMLEAGVSLTEALEAFSKQSSRMKIVPEIDSVREEISEGEQLSASMARRQKTFPPVAVGLVRAAEAVGDLAGMFTRLADWIGREQRIVRQVRSALAYPAVLAVVGTAITLFLVTAVLPRFESIYAQRAAELPPLTTGVLMVGRFISQEWILWLPALSLICMWMFLLRNSSTVMTIKEKFRFDAPVMRSVTRPAETARAFRTLSILLGSGVPLLDAVSICRDLSPWRRWKRMWDDVENAAREGRSVSDALNEAPMISQGAKAMMESVEGV